MDRLPIELLIMVTNYHYPYNLLNLARCSRTLCQQLLPSFYKQVARDESLHQSIIIFGGPTRQDATISALEKAQKAGAPEFTTYNYSASFPNLKVSIAGENRSIKSRSASFKCTLLGLAAEQGLEEVATFLHHSGVPIDGVPEPRNQGPTPLFIALANREYKVATRLLDLGASPVPYENGITAFHIAVAAGYHNLSRFVGEFDMDPNISDGDGNCPLAYLLSSVEDPGERVRQLSQLGANMNPTVLLNGRRKSLLNIALESRKWKLAEQLLNCGADPNGHGTVRPPLEIVCTQFPAGDDIGARCGLITKLLDMGANPNLKIPATGHHLPLLTYLVTKRLQREAECLLLCPELNLESSDSHGRTAISYALSTNSGCLPLAELLLQKKACIPDFIIENVVHLAGQWNMAKTHGKKRILAKHRYLKPICKLIRNYRSSSPNQDDDNVLDHLGDINFP